MHTFILKSRFRKLLLEEQGQLEPVRLGLRLNVAKCVMETNLVSPTENTGGSNLGTKINIVLCVSSLFTKWLP